jgi:protein-tyrosine-phosphatase
MTPTPTSVLFLCPHSAGKSVLAATYFRAAATRLGLQVDAKIGGTHPDETILPNVHQALSDQGFHVE